jgi:hypothetical protein
MIFLGLQLPFTKEADSIRKAGSFLSCGFKVIAGTLLATAGDEIIGSWRHRHEPDRVHSGTMKID